MPKTGLLANASFAPFRHRTFSSFWAATLASNLGTLIQSVGAGWMMTTISSSHSMVALVQASTSLPIMLFSLLAGALADNFDRRRVMLTAQCFMLVTSAVLAVFGFLGGLTPWLLLAFTFLIGCGGALNNPSWQASVGDIVPRDDLPAAVALNSMGFNLMRSIGPAIGGAIVAAAGASVAFAINSASYVALIVALLRWRRDVSPRRLPRESVGAAISAGLRYVAMSPNLMRVASRGFLFGSAAVSILALLPLVARDLVHGGALAYGILLGSFGLGAVGGALLNGRLLRRHNNEVIARGAFLGFALGVFIVGASREIWLTCGALMISGAFWVIAWSLFNVTVQLSTPRWVVGRALALYQTATFGGMAVGSWVWGVAADQYGVGHAFYASGVLLLAGAVVGLRFALPEFGTLNLDPLDEFNAPALRLDLKLRSGPILIMTDYRIAQEDVPAFLAAMIDRRRIRIRDGARRWSLARDLENPDIWTESYHVPTWLEYLRHNERRTQADEEVSERLLALHRGPGAPKVHCMIERQVVPRRDDTPLKNYPEPH